MGYEKMNLERFSENLKEGKYASATGARRGAGKADWTDKDKAKAHALIDAHFGESSAAKPAVKAAPKKAAAKKAAKVSVPAPVVKAAAAAKPAKKTAMKRRPQAAEAQPKVEIQSGSLRVPENASNPEDTLAMSHQLLTLAGSARMEIDKARKADPAADFSPIEKELRGILHRGLALAAARTPETAIETRLPPARATLPKHVKEETQASPSPVADQPNARRVVPSPVAQAAPIQPSSASEEQGGYIHPAAQNGTAVPMSEEETRIAEQIRSTQPQSTVSALPRSLPGIPGLIPPQV